MDAKHYDKLLTLVMEKLDQTEIEKNWLKHENQQLKNCLEVQNDKNKN